MEEVAERNKQTGGKKEMQTGSFETNKQTHKQTNQTNKKKANEKRDGN